MPLPSLEAQVAGQVVEAVLQGPQDELDVLSGLHRQEAVLLGRLDDDFVRPAATHEAEEGPSSCR